MNPETGHPPVAVEPGRTKWRFPNEILVSGPSTPSTMPPSKPPGTVRSPDLDLAEKIRAGDSGAFEELYRQHATRLYNLAYRMAGTANDADDLLQDVFLLAYRKIGSFRGESSLGTWLYRLAMNHCLDVLRSRQARMGHQTDSLDEDAAPVPSSAPALGAVNRIDLERAIGQLPRACRAAFLLHDVEGFGHQEVGAILGISEGTSKSQVHKARLRIRAYLTQPRVNI
jgi:RNA polymerase sigma-70 factor (ECF subfamily)